MRRSWPMPPWIMIDTLQRERPLFHPVRDKGCHPHRCSAPPKTPVNPRIEIKSFVALKRAAKFSGDSYEKPRRFCHGVGSSVVITPCRSPAGVEGRGRHANREASSRNGVFAPDLSPQGKLEKIGAAPNRRRHGCHFQAPTPGYIFGRAQLQSHAACFAMAGPMKAPSFFVYSGVELR